MSIVVSGAINPLPHRFDMERVLSDEELIDELMKEFDLGLQAARMSSRSFTDTDDAFVGIEFEKEELATTAVRGDVVN